MTLFSFSLTKSTNWIFYYFSFISSSSGIQSIRGAYSIYFIFYSYLLISNWFVNYSSIDPLHCSISNTSNYVDPLFIDEDDLRESAVKLGIINEGSDRGE